MTMYSSIALVRKCFYLVLLCLLMSCGAPLRAQIPSPLVETLAVARNGSGTRGYDTQSTNIGTFWSVYAKLDGDNNTKIIPVSFQGLISQGPGRRPAILVRFESPMAGNVLSLAQAMDGSPVCQRDNSGDSFIHVVGAISFANLAQTYGVDTSDGAGDQFTFAQVTPVRDMREDLASPVRDSLYSDAAPLPGVINETTTPVLVAGLAPTLVTRANEALNPLRLNALATGEGTLLDENRTFQLSQGEWRGGETLAVHLMSGDINMTVVGNTTCALNPTQLLAFGHTLLGTGDTQLPVSRAWTNEIRTATPRSYRLATAGQVIGTLVRDRASGSLVNILATPIAPLKSPMNRVPHLAIDCGFTTPSEKKSFHVDIVNHPSLTLNLIPIALGQALINAHSLIDDRVAKTTLTIETNLDSLRFQRSDTFFQKADLEAGITQQVAEVLDILSQEEPRQISIKHIQVDVSLSIASSRPTANIESLRVPRRVFAPGEEVTVYTRLQPYRKNSQESESRISIPEDAPEGYALVIVQGGSTQVEFPVMNGPSPLTSMRTDTSFEEKRKQFGERVQNDQLVTHLVFSSSIPSERGQLLTFLPSNLAAILNASPATGRVAESNRKQIVSANLPWLLSGVKAQLIYIKKPNMQELPTLAQTGEPSFKSFQFTVNGTSESVPLAPVDEVTFATLTSDTAPRPQVQILTDTRRRWVQSGPDFERGKRENIELTSAGQLRLRSWLELLSSPGKAGEGTMPWNHEFLWSLAGANDKVIVGTGPDASIHVLDYKQSLSLNLNSPTSKIVALKEAVNIHCVTPGNDGQMYAGTGPDGKILRIAPDGAVEVVPNVQNAKYVLSLVAAPKYVFAGTSPNGEIFRIPSQGDAQSICKLFNPNLNKSVTCLLAVSDTELYAGSAEGGIVYHIGIPKDGTGQAEVSVLYDTDQSAITGLARDVEGNVYAACAPQGRIYRIGPDGKSTLIYQSSAPLLGLALDQFGSLWTSQPDAVIEIAFDGTTTSYPLKGEHVTALTLEKFEDPNRYDHVLAGCSGTNTIYRNQWARKGTFESTIHDAGQPANWGRVRYQVEFPYLKTPSSPQNPQTRITAEDTREFIKIETRAGDSAEPDASWESWQKARYDLTSQNYYIASRRSRFLQYRVSFDSMLRTPILKAIAIDYEFGLQPLPVALLSQSQDELATFAPSSTLLQNSPVLSTPGILSLVKSRNQQSWLLAPVMPVRLAEQPHVSATATGDLIVAIEFPDFKIHVGGGSFTELGHAGVLLINGTSGLTKYYEYGRYDAAAKGLVRNQVISNAQLSNGRPTMASWKVILSEISNSSGQKGRILAAIGTAPSKFPAALQYVTNRMAQNNDPNRPEYSLLTNNCMHFVKSTFEAASLTTPLMIDPRPNSYIDELRDDYEDLSYDPVSGQVTLGP